MEECKEYEECEEYKEHKEYKEYEKYKECEEQKDVYNIDSNDSNIVNDDGTFKINDHNGLQPTFMSSLIQLPKMHTFPYIAYLCGHNKKCWYTNDIAFSSDGRIRGSLYCVHFPIYHEEGANDVLIALINWKIMFNKTEPRNYVAMWCDSITKNIVSDIVIASTNDIVVLGNVCLSVPSSSSLVLYILQFNNTTAHIISDETNQMVIDNNNNNTALMLDSSSHSTQIKATSYDENWYLHLCIFYSKITLGVYLAVIIIHCAMMLHYYLFVFANKVI